MPVATLQIGSLNDYLDRICQQIQLTSAQFKIAVSRYNSVGEWLTAQDTPLDRLSPEIFPQGSMLQRTTVRPMRLGQETVPFDIDTVCRCDFDPFSKTSQSLYGSVAARLMASRDFKARMDEAKHTLGTSGKCLRLAYTDDDFYLDVIPTCKDPSDAEGIRLYMCNPNNWADHTRAIDTWKRTDPIRFATWLQQRCEIGRPILEKRATLSVAPVPPQEEVEIKAPLRRVIQLLKRQRDRDFLGESSRPTSIMLSSLAGRHYRGEDSIVEAMGNILSGIAAQIRTAGSRRIAVPNPADEMALHEGGIEDLASPLEAVAYTRFCGMIYKLQKSMSSAQSAMGVPKLYPILAESFGDRVVRRAFNSAEEDVKRASVTGVLGASVGSSQIHVLTESKVRNSVQPVRENDFHLDN